MIGDVHRVLDIELIIVERGEIRPSQAFNLGNRRWAQPVILAAGISIAEDKDTRFTRRRWIASWDPHCFTLVAMTEPSASSSVTINGMSPSAWVAQERQGS